MIARILDNANDTKELHKEKRDEFSSGKMLAYYEVLDTIKNDLIVRDQNLEDYGLDFNLEDEFFG